MWSATARIRSASPTEVPPNFWTTNGIRMRLQTAHRPDRPRVPPPAPGWPWDLLPRWAIQARPLNWVGSRAVPSDKRARQRAAREARLAAEAQSQKRRKQIRNGIIVVVIAAVIVGIVFLVSGNNNNVASQSNVDKTTTTVPPRRAPTPSCRPRPTRWRSRRAARPHQDPDRRAQPEVHGRAGHDHRHVQDLHGHVQDDHRHLRRLARRRRPPRRRSTTSCSWPTRATSTA